MKSVSIEKIIKPLQLENLTPDIDLNNLVIKTPDVIRPSLFLTGYYEYFENECIQIIGYGEYQFLMQLDEATRYERYEKLLSAGIPCVVFTSLSEPDAEMLRLANLHNVPTFSTTRRTPGFVAELVRWLGEELAPSISVHGVLINVYGEGVMIMGESGVGKSETALELVHRGHRLVSDDVVVLKKVSDVELVGSAPDITKHLIELRGIGIIDVKMLYGVEHVMDSTKVDLVIRIEDWDKNKEYDRLGLNEETTEFLGNKIVCHTLPIKPGRNLAIIVETAAVNHRQKKMGYNAAEELYRRLQDNMKGAR